ncbi:MAG: type II secretion system secretin GspD [Desulfobacula sp.]|nr:type II secretion system secretin GspD [Desulfobacula sp.]
MIKKQRTIIIAIIILSLWTLLFRPDLTFAQQTPGSQSQKYVSIDFDEVDIRVFIKFISELTGENFVIDNRVKGKVNIISPGKITVKEAYKVFESVLEVNRFTAVKAGEISKIIPIAEARSKNVQTLLRKTSGGTSDKVVTQLIPLKYADANMIKQLFTPLLSKGSIMMGYTPTNTLIITDISSNIKRLLKIVDVIDIKDVGHQISIIPISNADAAKLEKLLNMLFKAKAAAAKKSPDQQVHIVSDERTNSIIILANEFNTLKVNNLISLLDQEIPRSDAKIQVYYLENARAEELATVLQSLSQKSNKQEAGKQRSPIVSENVKITHDKATNSLIIMADKEDYQVLETIIKKLDIPRPMVYLEALIMEVRDIDDFTLGIEWIGATSSDTFDGRNTGSYGGFTDDGSGAGVRTLPTLDANNALSVPGGFSIGLMGEAITIGGITFPNLGAAIRAVKKDEKVNIISTPQIMAMDNEEAQITVGENVPYLTSSGSGDQNYNSYEYRDVGVTLKITPQITQDRFVRLNIFQKVEKLASTANSSTPTTLKRTAETTVLVKDQTTMVIGGLIGEDLNETVYQVPCLGSIPLLGRLFKSTSRHGVQTNLFILLTPRIIENPGEAEEVFQEKNKQIKAKSILMYKDEDTSDDIVNTQP